MSFPATHISVIRRAASPDADVRARALETLSAVYWRPIYLYIRLSHQAPRERAEDLTQGFFADALRREVFAKYDSERAMFRTYVRTCVDRYVANERKSERRVKRGGDRMMLDIDVADLEQTIVAGGDPDRVFHEEWVRSVFSASLARLRETYARENRLVQLDVFDRYDVRPAAGDARPTYAELASQAGVPATTITNWLNAVRRDFRAEVLATLRDLTESDEEFRQEARALLGVTVE